MSWGVDLWDQLDCIADHTQRGIEFLERYNEFVKERCKVEAAYAKELKRLIKSYQPKKKEDDEEGFTCVQSFNEMLKEMNSIASQHEEVVDGLQQGIMKSLQAVAAELRVERKKNLEEAKRLQAQLEAQHAGLLKAKKKYEASFKDSEKAEEAYRRADDDINLSRAEVEKARLNSIQKSQICSNCKVEYASVLEKTNQFQRDYFGRALPQVYDQLQQLDEKRCAAFKQQLLANARCTKAVLPIVSSCLDSIVTAAENVQPSADTKAVIEKHKSGFNHPGDVPFEDLGGEGGSGPAPPAAVTGAGNGSNETPAKASNGSTGVNSGKASTLRATSGDKKRDRAGLSRIFNKPKPDEPREDFGHLPPQQQKKQLQKKIKELQHQLAKENNEREGMLKMLDVYKGNPHLGDPRSLDKQLDDNQLKRDTLAAELRKFEDYLDQAEGNGSGGTPGLQRKNSASSHQSTGSSGGGTAATDTSAAGSAPAGPPELQISGQPPANTQPPPAESATNSRNDLHAAQQQQVPVNHHDSFDETPGYGEVGRATARYPFEPTSEGSISMRVDEVFSIIEPDQGDGWTRVRRLEGKPEEGFVPTSYIAPTYY